MSADPIVRPDRFVDQYLKWLRSKFVATAVNGAIEITTPFLDRHNDYLQIYVTPSNGDLVLSDDGNTVRDLELSGCDLKSERRQRLLSTILNGFGVTLDGDELKTTSRPETFPQRKHALLQAMLAVNDMFLTAKSHVVSIFWEDVQEFLRRNDVRFVSNVQFTGRSGFVHTFDFVIPPSRNYPERVIRAINHPDRNSTTAFLFAWNDTRDVRSADAAAFAILNDSERQPPSDLLAAFDRYGATPIPWSRRDSFIDRLAA